MKKVRRKEPFKRKLGRFMLKHLVRALSNAGVIDPRDAKNRRWRLEQVLTLMIMGLVCGKLGFGDVEEMTSHLSGPIRRGFGVTGDISDGAMWDLCQRLNWEEIRDIIVGQGCSPKALAGQGCRPRPGSNGGTGWEVLPQGLDSYIRGR